MIQQQDRGQQEGREVDAPEEDVELQPGGVQPGDQHDHGKDELEELLPGAAAELAGQEHGVEVGAVEDTEPHVEQEEAEETMVAMTDAVTDEHAVVLALQDADVADVAVPGPGRRHGLAGGAKFPFRVLKKRSS